jgi:hypothetical protein
MSDTPGTSAAGDRGPKEKQLSESQPVGDMEMADLSSTDPKTANPAASAASLDSPDAQSPPGPLPDKDYPEGESSSKAQGKALATPSDGEALSIDPVDGQPDPADGELAVDIMLLLQTGARHPFRIDEKYLTKRNVTVTGLTETGKLDPFSITVYTLKELILRDWRKEWDQAPREPSAIRLIHFGRMLEDRMALNRKPLPELPPRWGLD